MTSVLLASIDQRKPGACPACGCPGRWIDHFGADHCEVCEPPPFKSMVKQREVLVGDSFVALVGSDVVEPTKTRQNESQSPFRGCNPFDGEKLPKGVFRPVADRPPRVPCDHSGGTTRELCSNKIWDRLLCATCGRLLDLVDTVSNFDEI